MIVVPFAGLDMYGMLHVLIQKDFVKAMIKLLDSYLNLAREQSKKHGEVANQLTVIFDMEGFNLKPFLWRPGKNIFMMTNYSYCRYTSCRFLFYFTGAYCCSWRAGHYFHPNVRGKLSGNSKDVLYNQW